MEKTIEFEVISKMDNDVKLAGYVYADDLDADVTDIYFYDDYGLEAGNYVPKPHCQEGSSEFEAYYDVVEAWKTDDLFLQFLSDFADENRTVVRDGYFLKINDGASFEFEYSDIDYEYKGMQTYVGKVHISFNRKNILDLIKDEGKQTELVYDLANYYDSSVFDDAIENGYFIFELPKSFFEDGFDEYDINSSIDEYVDVCREHLASYLTDMLDVGSFSSTLEQEIDTNADDWDLFIMDYFAGKSEEEFKEYLVEQGYEF